MSEHLQPVRLPADTMIPACQTGELGLQDRGEGPPPVDECTLDGIPQPATVGDEIPDELATELREWGLAGIRPPLPPRGIRGGMGIMPYRALDRRGLGIVWTLASLRQSTAAEWLRQGPKPIRHGIRGLYAWTGDDGQQHVSPYWLLWGDDVMTAELLKSTYLVRDVDRLCTLIGCPPWSPSVIMGVREVDAQVGKCYRLLLAADDPQQPKPKRK